MIITPVQFTFYCTPYMAQRLKSGKWICHNPYVVTPSNTIVCLTVIPAISLNITCLLCNTVQKQQQILVNTNSGHFGNTLKITLNLLYISFNFLLVVCLFEFFFEKHRFLCTIHSTIL